MVDPALRFRLFQEQIKADLLVEAAYQPVEKDICIVVRDQLEFVKQCVKSIQESTNQFQLYFWDNGSGVEMQEYLSQFSNVRRSEENLGFIVPNNELAAQGNSPYIVLLNSDTIVQPGWDQAMIAYLQQDPELAQTGYAGGVLNADGRGVFAGYGRAVDYIQGWCFCIPRGIYSQFGLFDSDHLSFAYCEDADFSLRLKEAGKEIHALYLEYVFHYGNKTIKQVVKEKSDCQQTFDANHAYIQQRWGQFLRESNASKIP